MTGHERSASIGFHMKLPSSSKPWMPALFIPAMIVGAAFFSIRVANLEVKNKKLTELSSELKNQLKAQKEVLGKIETQKETLSKALEKSRTQNRSLQAELDSIQTILNSAAEEKTYLEDILIHKTKEIESLSGQADRSPANASAMAPAPEASSQGLEERLKKKSEELARLGEQNQMLSRKLEKFYKIANAKIAEINVAKITLEDTIAKARQSMDSEWNSVDLGSIETKPKDPSAPITPKKEGKVLAVNEEHGFVVVDLGKGDGIKTDTVLTLSQGGENVGTLVVLEVRDAMTACNIGQISPDHRIQVNDLVRIGK